MAMSWVSRMMSTWGCSVSSAKATHRSSARMRARRYFSDKPRPMLGSMASELRSPTKPQGPLDVVALLSELAMLSLLAVSGWRLFDATPAKIAAMIPIPLGFAAASGMLWWGSFSPLSRSRISGCSLATGALDPGVRSDVRDSASLVWQPPAEGDRHEGAGTALTPTTQRHVRTEVCMWAAHRMLLACAS